MDGSYLASTVLRIWLMYGVLNSELKECLLVKTLSKVQSRAKP